MLPAPAHDPAALFAQALERFDRRKPVRVMGHFDADGLSAAALFARALAAAGWTAETRILARGESPWSAAMAAELDHAALGGLVVTDLGMRPAKIGPAALPVAIVDHHVPQGFGAEGAGLENTVAITGYGLDPVPTSSLLAWRCIAALGPPGRADLVWLAALGLVGDMADKAFPEIMAEAKPFGITALRDAAALVNAPRRTASGDAAPALSLLMRADGPKDLLSGRLPETASLLAAKEEVKAALEQARRVPPEVVGDVALIRFASPCQVHPLVAQSWRGRLKDKVVIAANGGYRPGWIHFAARTATDRDLVRFFRDFRPDDAGDEYGGGHPQASGGALTPPQWQAFLARLGFGNREEKAA